MTIAAGFVHTEGVLLCADTELTAGDQKLQGSKIFHFDSPSGRFAFVFAGHLYNAVATLHKIRDRIISSGSHGRPLDVVESVLDCEYRRLVLSQPEYEHATLDFWFIVAYKPVSGPVQMHVTDRVSMRQEQCRAAIGIGAVFAEQLMDTACVGIVTRGDFLTLAAYVLGSVKKRITHCGGASLFIDIGHNGSLTELYGDDYLKAIEEWFGTYQMLSWGLFARLADPHISDQDFLLNLEQFAANLVEQRRQWKDIKARHVQISRAYQIVHASKVKPTREPRSG